MNLTGTLPPPHDLHPSNSDAISHAGHVLRRIAQINFDHDAPFDGPHPVDNLIPHVEKTAEGLVDEIHREIMAEESDSSRS